MGGTIAVDTSYRNSGEGGPGARVVAELPLLAIPEPPQLLTQVTEKATDVLLEGSARVLVVDDDKVVRLALKRRFASQFEAGARVDEAPHGEAAMCAVQAAKAEGAPYDVVAVDHFLASSAGANAVIQVLHKYYSY